MLRVGILGSASYTGGEILRILVNHPEVEISYLESSSSAGKQIDQVHRFLKGMLKLELLNTPILHFLRWWQKVKMTSPHRFPN